MIVFLLLLLSGQFETTFKAGLVALNENQLSVAQSRLEEASRLEPRNAAVWLALAQTYWKLRKVPESQAAAVKAESLTTDPNLLRGLLTYYSETGNSEKCVELLRASLQRNPYSESDYFALAQIYLRQEKFSAALDTLDAGRRNFDKSAQLELAAGVAYYGLRRFPEAIDAFLKTNRLDPTVEQPYVFLGRMLDQAEDRLPRIVAIFTALQQREPDHYLPNFLLGKALLPRDSARAEPLLRKSISRNDGFWESHFQLGLLLEQQRHFEDAAREVRRAADLNPKDPVLHYRLARLYERLGRADEARAERALHANLSAVSAGSPVIK